ncbi:MAG: PhnD/SsuA/transferrin family substrate-binding protein [Sumerlaeia bacterium]
MEQEKTTELFRIGYLSRDSGLPLTTTSMNGLRKALLDDVELYQLLQEAGYWGVGLYEADGSEDLLPRLKGGEFDLAFCTTRNWVDVSGEYNAFLQTREPEDIINSRTGFALRRGVIFIGPTHPLFAESINESTPQATTVQRYFNTEEASPFAVVQSQDLAGYVAPLLWIETQFTAAGMGSPFVQQQFLWCRSGDEVVKTVVSGLATIGACEERELISTLHRSNLEDKQARLIKVIARTAPIPAHPVILHNKLMANDALRRRLQSVLREYARSGGLEGMQLNPSSNQDYLEAEMLMQRFREVSSGTSTLP